MELLSIKNPNLMLLKRVSSSPSSCRRPVSIVPRSVNIPPKGLGVVPLSINRRRFSNPSIIAFAASHEESKQPEIEVTKEEEKLKDQSEEAWKQTLTAFKEQALKMQNVSQEAYEVYSKKAAVVLKETSEQLKIQAENARLNLADIAREINEESKEYLSTATENSPETVKEVVETLSSATDDLDDISEVRDYVLGIPYGLLLSFGGFLSFMVTGSISAIRFGIILGGTLLGLSVSSLRSYKRGEPYGLALKGQAAIASIILLREIRLMSLRLTFLNLVTTLISGAMLAFYIYRIVLHRKERKGLDFEPGAEN